MNHDHLFTIIYGPTASGKTALAYELAEKKGANILSFDSRHIYRDMTIVTGKDLPPKNAAFQMFGIDLVSPDEEFSIRHFYEYVKPIVQEHRRLQKPLLLVGGSWQYVSVLLNPPASLYSERHTDQRTELQKLSIAELQTLVQKEKFERWRGMNDSDRGNPRRLIRALEVEPETHSGLIPVPLLVAGEYTLELLNPDLSILEERIRQRVESRLEAGALQETTTLLEKYKDWSLPAFSSTGYKVLRRHLEGEISLETAKELWFLQERQYVKRQKTWMKKITVQR